MKTKNDCLNVWKGIAAFAVVLIHCTLPGVPGEIIKGIARFAVPLFFLISGYFAYGREDAVLRRREIHILPGCMWERWRFITCGPRSGIFCPSGPSRRWEQSFFRTEAGRCPIAVL